MPGTPPLRSATPALSSGRRTQWRGLDWTPIRGALPHRECYRRSPAMTGAAPANRVAGVDGGEHQHGRAARGGVGGDGALPVSQAGGEGRILDELCAATGWHRKQKVGKTVKSERTRLERKERIAFGADRLQPALNIEKPPLPHDASLHPPMTACGHRVRFAETWREEFFEVPCRRSRHSVRPAELPSQAARRSIKIHSSAPQPVPSGQCSRKLAVKKAPLRTSWKRMCLMRREGSPI